MSIFVGLLTTDLIIAEADSLKDKRRVVRSLVTRLQNRLNISVAEVADQDAHRHTQIATVTVANSEAQVHRVLTAASGLIQAEPRVTVQSETLEIL